MRKITLGLAVLVSLLCVEVLGWTQEQIKEMDKRCKNGNSWDCYYLGDDYLRFNKDYQKAKFYFEKVCRKGNEKHMSFLDSCTNLGFIYDNGGYGVQPNSKKALELYTLACDKGEATACQNIGAMYSNGTVSVPRDLTKGMAYSKKACDIGNWMACINLARDYYRLGDQSKLAMYLKRGCALGRDDYTVQNTPEYKKDWQTACDAYDEIEKSNRVR